MKKLICILSFVLFFLTSCKFGIPQLEFFEETVDERSSAFKTLSSVPDLGTNSRYSFVIITDVHFGAYKNVPENAFLEEFEALLKNTDPSLRPRFVVCLGDSLTSGRSSEASDYNDFCEKIKNKAKSILNVPDFYVYTILGNHDLFNNGWSVWKKEIYPYTSCYTFTAKSSAAAGSSFDFFFLDTGNGTLGSAQLEDLQEKLKASSNPKIIFSHYAVYAGGVFYYTLQDTMERNILLSAFAKSNVKHVFAGHAHSSHSFTFNSSFSERVTSSFLDKAYTLVTVDEGSGSVTSDEHFF